MIGEAGAMRIPLIPNYLAKQKWCDQPDDLMSDLTDKEINDLIHGNEVRGNKADDIDFPMPLIRHYIKEFGIPVRRFNMNVAIAKMENISYHMSPDFPTPQHPNTPSKF